MNPTLLIGLDGATFAVIDVLTQDGTMPFLRSFIEDGSRARLMSTANPFTPPAWTTVMTGRTPGHHGVFDFARVEMDGGIPRSRMATSRDVAVETIWAIASGHNRRVTVLNFPMTYPPRPIRGSLVPGWVRWRHLKRSVYPAELWESLSALPGFDAHELALDWEMERKALKSLPKEEYEDWIRFHIKREKQWMDCARWLMENRPADLTAVLFDGVDKLQHLCWRFVDPACNPGQLADWELRARELCLDYFRQMDVFLRELVDRAGSDARTIVVSDHGFGPTSEIIYPNSWLHRHGYLHWADDVDVVRGDKLNVDGHRDPSTLFDWARTQACVLSAGGSGVWINVAESPEAAGVQPDEYEDFRELLRRRLVEWKDDAGRPVLQKALLREEAFPGPHSQLSPDILTVPRDGGSISVLKSKELHKLRGEDSGAHRYDGIFLAGGTGIRRGATVADLQIADVAPTVLYSLGLKIPSDFEGQVVKAAFDEETLRERPPEVGPSTQKPDPFPAEPAETSVEQEEQQVLMERLKALGYLE